MSSTGIPGRKYGLAAPKFGLQLNTKPQGPAKGGGFSFGMSKAKAAPAQAPGKGLSMFASALEDEEMVEDRESARKKANLQVRAEQKSKSKLMEKEAMKTLAEDASVFEYDTLYDDIQSGRQEAAESHRQQKSQRQSR